MLLKFMMHNYNASLVGKELSNNMHWTCFLMYYCYTHYIICTSINENSYEDGNFDDLSEEDDEEDEECDEKGNGNEHIEC